MSEEEKKAIEYLKQNSMATLRYDNFGNILSPLYYGTFEKEIILNLIEKQEKVMDEMTKELDLAYNNENKYYLNFEKNICKRLMNPQSEEDDCYSDIYDERSCLNCIKEYFYRKVENNE